MDTIRIQLYWPGRTDPPVTLARQLSSFLAEAGAVHPDLKAFSFHDRRSGAIARADSFDACEAAILAGEGKWKTGNVPRTAYEQRFFLGPPAGSPVAFTLTCGIEPLGLDPIWTPNRLEYEVRAGARDERASRAVLEAVMRAAVAAFRPDWGFAGSEWVPLAPLPLFSDGTPVAGWMTYLRAAFPEVPRALPQPAVVYPVASLGTLIVAHPEPYRDGDRAQREAVERVQAALRAAGVLIPPHRLAPA